MRKIIFISALFLSAAIISCSGDSDSDVSVGYIDPGLGSAKEQAIKSYTLGTESCASSKSCGAIIYVGTLDANYVGFAAGKDSTNPNFTLKIYWTGTSIPATLNTTSYTISVNDGTYTYTNTSDNLHVNITSGPDANSVTVYTIDFQEEIIVSDGSGHNFTIANTNSIVAYKYP